MVDRGDELHRSQAPAGLTRRTDSAFFRHAISPIFRPRREGARRPTAGTPTPRRPIQRPLNRRDGRSRGRRRERSTPICGRARAAVLPTGASTGSKRVRGAVRHRRRRRARRTSRRPSGVASPTSTATNTSTAPWRSAPSRSGTPSRTSRARSSTRSRAATCRALSERARSGSRRAVVRRHSVRGQSAVSQDRRRSDGRRRSHRAHVHGARRRDRLRLLRLARLVCRRRGGRARADTRRLHARVPFDDVAALEAAVSDSGTAPRGDRDRAGDRAVAVHGVDQRARASWRRQSGAVLIFDEIKTGFRLRTGGYQAFADVVPDLAAFGKAMANGFPLAAVVGRSRHHGCRAQDVDLVDARERRRRRSPRPAPCSTWHDTARRVRIALGDRRRHEARGERRRSKRAACEGIDRSTGIDPMWMLRGSIVRRASSGSSSSRRRMACCSSAARTTIAALAHDDDAIRDIERWRERRAGRRCATRKRRTVSGRAATRRSTGTEPLIDAHAHFYHAGTGRADWADVNAARFRAGERIGITYHVASVLGTTASRRRRTFRRRTTSTRGNDVDARDLRDASRDRVRMFVTVNPNYTDHALARDRAVRRRAARSASSCSPAAAPTIRCSIRSPRSPPSTDLPILHHIWQHRTREWPSQEISDGADLARLAARHPRATFILAHIGGGGDYMHTFPAVVDRPEHLSRSLGQRRRSRHARRGGRVAGRASGCCGAPTSRCAPGWRSFARSR